MTEPNEQYYENKTGRWTILCGFSPHEKQKFYNT